MGCCKLTLPVNGRPLVSYALEAARAVLEPLLIVLGPESPPALRQALTSCIASGGGRCHIITASLASLGQSESLKAGVRYLLEIEPQAPGVMVVLGDQPLLSVSLLRSLCEAFRESQDEDGESFCVAPCFEGRRGNPVILHRALFPEILKLEGDVGARSLLAAFPLRLVPCGDDSCLMDVDTPDRYECLTRRFL